MKAAVKREGRTAPLSRPLERLASTDSETKATPRPQPPRKALFSPGELMAASRVLDSLYLDEPDQFLARHVAGDWGLVSPDQRRRNEMAIADPGSGEIRSVYTARSGRIYALLTSASRLTTTLYFHDAHLQGIPLAVLESLRSVVDHLLDDERRDYAEADNAQRANHIFLHLDMLNRWLGRI